MPEKQESKVATMQRVGLSIFGVFLVDIADRRWTAGRRLIVHHCGTAINEPKFYLSGGSCRVSVRNWKTSFVYWTLRRASKTPIDQISTVTVAASELPRSIVMSVARDTVIVCVVHRIHLF